MNTSTVRYPKLTDSQVMNGWLRIGEAAGTATCVRLADITAWESVAKAHLVRIYAGHLQLDIKPDEDTLADDSVTDPLDELFELLVTHLLETSPPRRDPRRSAVT